MASYVIAETAKNLGYNSAELNTENISKGVKVEKQNLSNLMAPRAATF